MNNDYALNNYIYYMRLGINVGTHKICHAYKIDISIIFIIKGTE